MSPLSSEVAPSGSRRLPPVVEVSSGPYLHLVWHRTIGVQTREPADQSVFDVRSVLDPLGYPLFRLAAEGDETSRRVLELAQELDGCALCHSPRSRSPRTHGALERAYERREKRTARTRTYCYLCSRCRRAWEVTLAGERTRRCRLEPPVQPSVHRRFSVRVRSGGTPWDCVEHEDLVVDMRGVYYAFQPDVGEPETTRLAHQDFLDPACRLRAAFPELIEEIDREIELVLRFLASRPSPPADLAPRGDEA